MGELPWELDVNPSPYTFNEEAEAATTSKEEATPKGKGDATPVRENREKNKREGLAGRYYMAPDTSKRCFNCGSSGHFSRECTAPKAVKICFLCAMPGHETRDCHNEICFNCDTPGHRARDCPERRRPRSFCHFCQRSGHNATDCDQKKYRKLSARRRVIRRSTVTHVDGLGISGSIVSRVVETMVAVMVVSASTVDRWDTYLGIAQTHGGEGGM